MRKFIREHICIKLLLPVLFIAYTGSISLFPHTHIVDGCRIVHSHPFQNGHEHEDNEAETIQQLSIFHTDGEILFAGIPELYTEVTAVFPVPSETEGYQSSTVHSETRRGPPSILFS